MFETSQFYGHLTQSQDIHSNLLIPPPPNARVKLFLYFTAVWCEYCYHILDSQLATYYMLFITKRAIFPEIVNRSSQTLLQACFSMYKKFYFRLAVARGSGL